MSSEVTGRDAQEQRHALLAALHPAGYRDLRALHPREHARTRALPAEDLAGVDAFAEEFSDRNVYVGVAPRVDAAHRDTGGCAPLHVLFSDQDYKDSGEAEARATLAAFALPPSATVSSGGGLQSYWLLARPIDPTNAKPLLRALAAALGADLRAAEAARILRLPGTLNYKYTPPRPVVVESLDLRRRYRTEEFAALVPASSAVDAKPRERAPLPTVITAGRRNETLFKEACRGRRLGWSEQEIAAALRVMNVTRCQPPLAPGELEDIARSAARYQSAPDTYAISEIGDAEFFGACNSDTLRFDHRRGLWLLFNGNVWVPQTNGEVSRLALDAIRARQRAAIGSPARLRWAVGGESRARQNNLVALAQNLEPLADAGDGWDADPWLLGAPNGVVDLRTGKLRPGRPEDRITMRVRAAFDPEAICPLFDKTINEIFENRDEIINYVDKEIGYSLTGDCREESLVMCFGGGGNGKGVLMNTIGHLMGDYADDLPFSAFELHTRTGIPNDIAKIVNKRFVTASESGESVRLNEARVKALTGRDPITARFLHREFFTFQPVAKFWLSTNHKPDIRDNTEGFWRRLHLIPFRASFIGKEDRGLKDRLRDELPGILARAVRGCLAWQREGLRPPPEICEATKRYRDDSAPLARFLDECCVVEPTARATFGALFTAYVRWAGRTGGRMGRHEFSEALHQRFLQNAKNTQRVEFVGVGVLDVFREEPER
jgi:putative DNA primase/helicase